MARVGAAGPGAAGVGAAGVEPAAEEPKSVSKAVKPLDSVDHLEPLGADPLATLWVAAPRTGARRREGVIYLGDGERTSLPSKWAS